MKKNRHSKIIELIENNEVETQEQLADLLKKDGYEDGGKGKVGQIWVEEASDSQARVLQT